MKEVFWFIGIMFLVLVGLRLCYIKHGKDVQ